MQEFISQALTLLRGAWRYRWPAVATAWVLALAGWAAVQLIPDKYESRTQVYVDTESLLKPLLTGLAVNRDVMSEVAMMQAVLLSRPNLAKVAEKNDLFLKATTRREQEAVIDELAKKIQLSRPTGFSRQGENTFVVTYSTSDPKVAHSVVRTLLDTFMEDTLGMKRSDAGVAQRFLQSQLKDYEARLNEAEQRLAAFKQSNVGLLPGFGGDYFQRLDSEANLLQQQRQRLSQMTQRRNELARQLGGEDPTLGMTGSVEGAPIDSQIARYRGQLDQLLLQYTDKHPQVQSIRETIAVLEAEKRAGKKISTKVAPPVALANGDQALVRSMDVNPVYQNLRMSLSQADADLAELRGQVQAQQALVNQLRGRVNAMPDVEAELARLNRDYEVNKEQYETLLKRFESAKISQQAEDNTENVKFRVVEPPTKPEKPSGPLRPLLDSLVLLGSLAAGIALAVLLSQLHPTFSTRDVLRKVAGVPVLGAVTAALRNEVLPWYQRQSVLVGGAVAALFAVFVLNMLLTEPVRAALRNFIG